MTYTRWFFMAPALMVLGSLSALGVAGCRGEANADDGTSAAAYARAAVSPDGETITFPPQNVGLEQIKTSVVQAGTATIPVIAPARVVATFAGDGEEGRDKVLLFESQEVTSLYSQYLQGRANLARAQKNYDRTKEMFQNHGATAKDMNEAETDLGNARATSAETQAKLRAAGFDPAELEAAPAATAWLISDVPESELDEVQHGEEVDVYFSAFPEKKFAGHETAIGDVVDPVTRTVKVRVTIPNPGRRFLPGMFARIDFGDPRSGIIILPASAVVSVEEHDYAFVETAPGTFTRRAIVIRNTDSRDLIVEKGLAEGEKVVISGAMLLKGLSFGF